MKKWNLFSSRTCYGKLISLGGFILCALFLSACGNKDLSFQEAKEIAMQESNLVSNLLFKANSPTQQHLTLNTTITDGTATAIDLALTLQSQQDKANKKSTTNLAFNADITSEEASLTTSGELTAFITPENLFFIIEKFWIQSSDPSVAMMSALLQGVEAQRFKFPLSWEYSMFEGMNTYLTTLATIREKEANLFIEKGNQPYQGIFSQFSGKPAYQYTLNQEEFQSLTQEIVDAAKQFSQETANALPLSAGQEDTAALAEIDIEIPLYEGNFVILGNNKVATVVDNFEIISNEISMIGSYRYSPDGMMLQIREKENGQEFIHINIAKTNKNTYSVDIQAGGVLIIKGTATTTLKKSELNLGFDLTITANLTDPILSEDGEILNETSTNITIPFKWNRKYNTIKSITITPPTEAIDITEMLGGLLWGGMFWMDSDYYGDYDEYDYYGDYDEYGYYDEDVYNNEIEYNELENTTS